MKKITVFVLSLLLLIGACAVPVSAADAYDKAFIEMIGDTTWLNFFEWTTTFTEEQGPSVNFVDWFMGISGKLDKYVDEEYGIWATVPAAEYEALVFSYFKKSDRLLRELRNHTNAGGGGYTEDGSYIVSTGGFGGPCDEYTYTGYKSLGNNRYEVHGRVDLFEPELGNYGTASHMFLVEYTGEGVPRILAIESAEDLPTTQAATTTTNTTTTTTKLATTTTKATTTIVATTTTTTERTTTTTKATTTTAATTTTTKHTTTTTKATTTIPTTTTVPTTESTTMIADTEVTTTATTESIAVIGDESQDGGGMPPTLIAAIALAAVALLAGVVLVVIVRKKNR